MNTKNDYSAPEVREIQIHLEGSVLTASTILDDITGEDITYGDEFDPWN